MNNKKRTRGRVSGRRSTHNNGENRIATCNTDAAANRVADQIHEIKKAKIPHKQKVNLLSRAQWDLQRKLGLPVNRLY
jgi:hypothetical protein